MTTIQASKNVATMDGIVLDPPIFDPKAFRLNDEQAKIIASARELGQIVFAGRAAAYDREAIFPTENYRDLHRVGLLGIAIPKKHGGLGADYQTYALAAAEIARYCGATALTWNMHVCSTLWSGPLADDLDMDVATRDEHERRRALHYKRIVSEGAVYSQPFSEGGAAAAGGVAFGTEAKPVKGGWIVNGKKIFASLAGHADYYGVLCTEISEGEKSSRRNTLYLALPAKAEGISVVGDWDPLGMRGTVSRTLLFKDVFVPDEAALMPRGVYFQAAMRWPHMFLTLSPTYMGWRKLPTILPCAISVVKCRAHRRLSGGCIRPSRSRWRKCRSSSSKSRRSGFRRSPRPAPIPARNRFCAHTPPNTRSWKARTISLLWRSAPAAVRRC
jgi:alkylation response protein AidB-like acyl-CoA dehydrogenase